MKSFWNSIVGRLRLCCCSIKVKRWHHMDQSWQVDVFSSSLRYIRCSRCDTVFLNESFSLYIHGWLHVHAAGAALHTRGCCCFTLWLRDANRSSAAAAAFYFWRAQLDNSWIPTYHRQLGVRTWDGVNGGLWDRCGDQKNSWRQWLSTRPGQPMSGKHIVIRF